MMDEILQRTRNIYAVGRNYVAHARELGNQPPQEPVIFCKTLQTLTTETHLVFPQFLRPIHYEAELVLRVGRSVPQGGAVALECVSHVGLGLDFTARELQNKLKEKGLPWHLAKNFQNACFVAGFSNTVDVNRPIRFDLHQNGQLRQSGDTRAMIFPFDRVLAFLVRFGALEEGDLIFTGTPAGVGPVAPGDVLRVSSQELDLAVEVSVAFAD